MLAGRILSAPRSRSRGFGFVARLAERSLESAVAFRARESKRVQQQRLRMEKVAALKRKRATQAEARKRKNIRLRLKLEKDLTMEEILRRPHQS